MPIKLAVITDEIDEDLVHALDVMAEYGVHIAELRSIEGKNISTLTLAEIEEIKRTLDRHGAHAIGVASPFYKTELPGSEIGGALGALHGAKSAEFDDQIPLLHHCISAAKILGAPYVRTFTFWKRSDLTAEIEDRIAGLYVEPAKIAKEAGITLLIENEHVCYAGTGEEAARIVAKIDSPNVRAVWDPGNAIFAGEHSYAVGYAAIKPYLAHVHVKDAVSRNGDHQWVLVGQGHVNWAGQVAALKADGYDGYLSLETHYNSGQGKEASSRACLKALGEILESS